LSSRNRAGVDVGALPMHVHPLSVRWSSGLFVHTMRALNCVRCVRQTRGNVIRVWGNVKDRPFGWSLRAGPFFLFVGETLRNRTETSCSEALLCCTLASNAVASPRLRSRSSATLALYLHRCVCVCVCALVDCFALRACSGGFKSNVEQVRCSLCIYPVNRHFVIRKGAYNRFASTCSRRMPWCRSCFCRTCSYTYISLH
jgi:hypothetical protein